MVVVKYLIVIRKHGNDRCVEFNHAITRRNGRVSWDALTAAARRGVCLDVRVSGCLSV